MSTSNINITRISTATGVWNYPLRIAPNKFVHKSLSCWSCNIGVGCAFACRFCYVPATSTNKLKPALGKLGVKDPDAQWGEYSFLRPYEHDVFAKSVRAAEQTSIGKLNADGNRAVMFCTTTDPYQLVQGNGQFSRVVLALMEAALNVIRDDSTLNVRILTRSPLARSHFALFKSFGNRLLFGVSLPTLNDAVAKIYEPNAPSPFARLRLLKDAADFGLHVYAAMAPTFPELTPDDLHKTLYEVANQNPVTIFHEPINVRAENVERINAHARTLGVAVKTEVFKTPETWAAYAWQQHAEMEVLSEVLRIRHLLHPWPDAALARHLPESGGVALKLDPKQWLDKCWATVSAWPGRDQQ